MQKCCVGNIIYSKLFRTLDVAILNVKDQTIALTIISINQKHVSQNNKFYDKFLKMTFEHISLYEILR